MNVEDTRIYLLIILTASC